MAEIQTSRLNCGVAENEVLPDRLNSAEVLTSTSEATSRRETANRHNAGVRNSSVSAIVERNSRRVVEAI
jgi:hypothetical protein